MKSILLVLLVAPAFAFQTVPKAVTPEEAPTSARKGAANELEGVNSSEDGVMSQGRYEGGSVPFKVNKVLTYVNEREVVIVQNKQRFGIPVKAIGQVLYGNGVAARVGTATGSAVPSAETKGSNPTVAGIVWTKDNTKYGVVLRIDKGDFDNFMNALQTVTRMKAVAGNDR